jgi:hypothetical protein
MSQAYFFKNDITEGFGFFLPFSQNEKAYDAHDRSVKNCDERPSPIFARYGVTATHCVCKHAWS